MSVLDTGIDQLEARVPKLISASTHGIIDYAHAAFFFTVGLCCTRSNKPAAAAAFATGGFVLVQSLLTDYRYGVKPVLPFETHGKMDAVFAATSWLVPQLCGFAGTGAATIFQLNSVVESSVVAMTNWDSQQAHAQRLEA